MPFTENNSRIIPKHRDIRCLKNPLKCISLQNITCRRGNTIGISHTCNAAQNTTGKNGALERQIGEPLHKAAYCNWKRNKMEMCTEKDKRALVVVMTSFSCFHLMRQNHTECHNPQPANQNTGEEQNFSDIRIPDSGNEDSKVF